MSTAMATNSSDSKVGEISLKLEFTKNLNHVVNRIHATGNIDEIMLDVSKDICTLFNADRLTIYVVAEDNASLISKVKTGLNSFKDLKLPIAEQSVAGYAAMHKKLLNIKDVYDEKELAGYSSHLRFLQEVDKRTGYRTKQMLVAPILDATSGDLIGVIQVINNKAGVSFAEMIEEGVQEVAQTMAVALRQRQQSSIIKTKYDYLVADAVLSAAEFELATRTARRKGVEIEEVLIDEFQVSIPALGKALSSFFGVPHEPYKADRIKPADLLKNLKREYVESSHWIPIEETQEGLVILTTDPERTQASRVVNNIFPKHRLVYRVCSQREFKQTLGLFYGGGGSSDSTGGFAMDESSMDDLLTSLGEDEEVSTVSQEDVSAAADNELVKLVNKIIVDAYRMGASDIHIEPLPGKGKTGIRLRKDGSLLNYIEVPATYRNALVTRLKIMCDLDISEKRKPQDGKIKFKKFGPLDIELRVATLPSQGGVEDVVMRILASGEPLPLEKMGFSARNSELVKETVSKPYGLFFVCGPTGSGKTT
ncbi:MAG: ATPase, T2SS/T4P/T4SS family, partial [Gallionella sp.]|nr:ATPase, T2SS/T4P/T4SS family [Gallionella sp.]